MEPHLGKLLPLPQSGPISEGESPSPPSSPALRKLPRIDPGAKRLRVLDFDIETRRIGFHSAGRFGVDGCEPVMIAVSWEGESKVLVWRLDREGTPAMLGAFRTLYESADLVTGHYIRRFDLPIINGALLEHGLPLLTSKKTWDTKGDLRNRQGLSASQENLSLMLKVGSKKFHMTDHAWRGVARLEPEALADCERRVASDVRQHKALKRKLIERGALRPPRRWSP